ncbi:hypothetical protein BDQ17DRAFT_1333436 [Cyathus striatus]|nr:hypothetical protein BDQ17DRAFT_1333436 [Cyathus striatus]
MHRRGLGLEKEEWEGRGRGRGLCLQKEGERESSGTHADNTPGGWGGEGGGEERVGKERVGKERVGQGEGGRGEGGRGEGGGEERVEAGRWWNGWRGGVEQREWGKARWAYQRWEMVSGVVVYVELQDEPLRRRYDAEGGQYEHWLRWESLWIVVKLDTRDGGMRGGRRMWKREKWRGNVGRRAKQWECTAVDSEKHSGDTHRSLVISYQWPVTDDEHMSHHWWLCYGANDILAQLDKRTVYMITKRRVD